MDATQAIVAVGAFSFLMGLMTGVGLWVSHRLGNWTSAATQRAVHRHSWTYEWSDPPRPFDSYRTCACGRREQAIYDGISPVWRAVPAPDEAQEATG